MALVLVASPALAASLPSTVAARQAARELIMGSITDWVTLHPYHAPARPGAGITHVSSAASADAAYLLFRAGASGDDDPQAVAQRGNVIIKRDRGSGAFLQAKVFFRDQDGSFVRIFPQQERSVMDVYLLGARVYGQVAVPIRFPELLVASLERIIELTALSVDWPLLLQDQQRPGDRRILQLIEDIRPQLPALAALDTDDGAMDASGNYVYIDTGERQPDGTGGFNCSGFCKWIIDGYYFPIEGAFTDLEELQRKDIEIRGHRWSTWYEALRDPYYGLDWARNLAAALEQARRGGNQVDPEAADVREVEFGRYREDVGYPLERAELLLYTLAARSPGRFYIGSINREFGSAPVLRQHSHLALFFPYFDAAGDFRIVQVDRNLERTVASLVRRYPGAYIHLTGIDADGTFDHGRVAGAAR
jgi:hypothetical protein